jgi:hypothetical protein
MKKPSTAHLRLANRLAITAPCRTGGALELVSPCHRTPTRPRGKLLCAELLRHLLTMAELAARCLRSIRAALPSSHGDRARQGSHSLPRVSAPRLQDPPGAARQGLRAMVFHHLVGATARIRPDKLARGLPPP